MKKLSIIALTALLGLSLAVAPSVRAMDEPTAFNGKTCTIVGTNKSDNLVGTDGLDVICGLGGDDNIDGGSGNDTIDGGTGRDTIDSGTGRDVISGGSGNDTIDSGAGNDTIDGGTGRDVISGGSGNDTIDSGAGRDIVSGGSGNDTIFGGDGNDALSGSGGKDKVAGEAGSDTVGGGPGIDNVDGGSGSDTCNNERGKDSCETIDKQRPDSVAVKIKGTSKIKKSSDHPRVKLEITFSEAKSPISYIGLTWAKGNGNEGANTFAVVPSILPSCSISELPEKPLTSTVNGWDLIEWAYAANQPMLNYADGWMYSCLKSGNARKGVISAVWFFNSEDPDFVSSPLGAYEVKIYHVIDFSGNAIGGCYKGEGVPGCDMPWPRGLRDSSFSLTK